MLSCIKRISSITQLETSEELSPVEFLTRIHSKAKYFEERYLIGTGASVLLLKNNSIDFFVDLLALFQLQATVIPLDPLSMPTEIENIIKNASVSLIIGQEDEKFLGLKISEKLKGIALVLYTSGTTGTPKGAMLSYGAIESKMETLKSHIRIEEFCNTLCALPTFFGHGLICNSLFGILFGEKFFIAKKFDLENVSRLNDFIYKHKITFFSTVPSVWTLILNFSLSENSKLASLKRVHCASSILTDEKAKVITDWLGSGVRFFNVYGITEMSGWVAYREYCKKSDINCFENFWNVEKKISSEGELFLKSKYMFAGYLNNSDATKNAMTDGGYFRTGDVFVSEVLKGRIKHVINKNGVKIYPQEIDDLLLNSGLVHDVHTFGIENEFSGEQIGVAVVPRENVKSEDLKKFCEKFISAAKTPDQFFVLKEIKRTNRGKINNKALIASLQKDNENE
jgi:acyl-CoA synthetase (AMP-forming)/AMP-acid ligase II